ncbi:hypothetical protein JCM11641_006481 [Rhodosporidiobolus odoratus]
MPVPTSTINKLVLKPYEGSHGFGVEASGIDINTITDEQFKELERAVYEYSVVVLKGQKDLQPPAQQRLGVLFDPETPADLGHMEHVRARTTIFGAGSKDEKPHLAGARLVNINGAGSFKAGHYGVPHDFTLNPLNSKGFHKVELTEEEIEGGHVRFQRWHIDWPAQKGKSPAPCTTIWAHTLPSAEPVTVHWDDGSGFTMSTRPGSTAFFSAERLYNSLSPEQKTWADNALIEYPPSPYERLKGAKADGLGLRMFDEGNETPLEDCQDSDPKNALVCPLVWINPITGRRALQPHAIIAWKLHVRSSPDEDYEIIDDLPTVRKLLDELQRPFITPENVCRGPRLLHQLQLVASDDPWAPKRIPGQPYYLDKLSKSAVNPSHKGVAGTVTPALVAAAA